MHLETTLEHLNFFLAPLNHPLCPFHPISIEKECLSSIRLRRQNLWTNKTYLWESPGHPWIPYYPLNLLKGFLSVINIFLLKLYVSQTQLKWPLWQCVFCSCFFLPIIIRVTVTIIEWWNLERARNKFLIISQSMKLTNILRSH